MTDFHAEQYLHVSGSESTAKVEIRLAVDYSMVDGAPDCITMRILDREGRRFAVPTMIKYPLLASDDFIDWLVFEAAEIEQERRG